MLSTTELVSLFNNRALRQAILDDTRREIRSPARQEHVLQEVWAVLSWGAADMTMEAYRMAAKKIITEHSECAIIEMPKKRATPTKYRRVR